jgi:hypothetical protein
MPPGRPFPTQHLIHHARESLELSTLPGTMKVVSYKSVSIASLERLHSLVNVDALFSAPYER